MKFLVVGCGSIGERHLSNLLSLGEHVAGCDVSNDIKNKIKSKYDIPFYNALEEAFTEYLPDAVLVCTPNHLHIPIAEQALKNNCHVFIEKPISNKIKGVEKLIELRDEKDKVVLVGCNLRFHLPIKYIKGKIDSGDLGRLLIARLQYGHYLPNWRPSKDYRNVYSAKRDMGGGVLLDGIHEIDYATWLFGKPDEIFSYNLKAGDLEIDVEDVGEILLRYKDAIVNIHIDYLRHSKMRSCEIIGTGGTILWQSFGKIPEVMKVTLYSSNGDIKDEISGEVDSNTQYLEEIRHFINCIKGKEKPMNPIEHAFQSLRIVELAKMANLKGTSIEM